MATSTGDRGWVSRAVVGTGVCLVCIGHAININQWQLMIGTDRAGRRGLADVIDRRVVSHPTGFDSERERHKE